MGIFPVLCLDVISSIISNFLLRLVYFLINPLPLYVFKIESNNLSDKNFVWLGIGPKYITYTVWKFKTRSVC